MFSAEAIRIIEIVDKHVSEMNKSVKSPYYFTWALPSNHSHVEITNVSHFCIKLGKYLIQETAENIERNAPVELLYFFGRINNLASCTIPDNIADHWNVLFTSIIHKNYLALDYAARGYHNTNNSEFRVITSESKIDSEDSEVDFPSKE
jgi:hypothetical protein